jgi:hypothetical protein
LEHPRVKRWRTTQIHTIRAFTDIDALGQKVLRYKDFTEEEIAEQRARHFLPGTERLLKDSCYRHIYTFSTDRGVGMIAQFIFKQIIHNGVLYLGIDEKKPLIFHKYFEDVDFKDSTNNVFSDNEKVKNETDTEEDAIEEWNSQDEYNLDISKNGVLKFSYSDHELHVFPIRQDLFEKTLH